MNSKNHLFPFRKFFAAFWLFLGWFAQVVPLAAFSAPADWKFETLQNVSDEWWQTLSVETVPGVVYHLQKSTTLAPGDWTTISTTYGTGAKWVCPIFPGSAPSVAPPAGTPTLPATPVTPFRLAFLVLEKTTTGDTLISWSSLDDHTSRRELLTGVTLDSVWDDFDAGYLNGHGNYLFGISPRLATPVTFTAGATTLGPLDTAMVAAFTAALPAITAHIQNSVANAANYNPQQDNSGEKAFYRFSADWSVDSDGDGRFDWQEIILDGNNPFTADTDGDGIPDQAAGAGGGNGLPTPTDAQPATPLAHIQQQILHARRFVWHLSPDYQYGPEVSLSAGSDYSSDNGSTPAELQALRDADTYGAFTTAFGSVPYRDAAWEDRLQTFDSSSRLELSETPGEKIITFMADRSRFRLKLTAPAPPGGYRIPMRLARIRYAYDPDNLTSQLIPASASQPPYEEIILKVAEGQTEGTPVEVDTASVDENQDIYWIPACLTTRENDVMGPDGHYVQGPVDEDGACVVIDESFVVDSGINFPLYGIPGQAETKIHWRKRKLNGDGTFGEWSLLTMTGYEATPYEGIHTQISLNHSGIFQMQALLVLPNGTEIEFPFVRMRNAKSIKDSLDTENALQKAGAPDFFGVTYDAADITIRDTAVSWLGSTQYRFDAQMKVDPTVLFNPDMERKDKCTLFLLHVANTSGAPVPYYIRYGVIPYAPLAREDWYRNPEDHVDLDLAGWINGGSGATLAPGRVIAGFGTGRSNGHVGILDYDGTWIGAGPKTVNKYINMQNLGPQYRPFAIRYFEP